MGRKTNQCELIVINLFEGRRDFPDASIKVGRTCSAKILCQLDFNVLILEFLFTLVENLGSPLIDSKL